MMLRLACLLFFAFATSTLLAGEDPAAPVDADLLLAGGTVYDGSLTPGQVGDVAIRGDKIVAVGKFPAGVIGKTLDCRGLLVTPGFIDLHNHSDSQIVDRRTRACVNYLTQGCTTIVTGNCGGGPVDAGKYLRQIDEAGAGVNVAHLLPQGALRQKAVGSDQRAATPEELDQMRKLAEQAMQDGVWGMSSGLIYVPSSYADTDELVAIAKVVGKHGGIYASHIRSENLELLTAINEALEIGRRAELPVHVSHFKSSGKDAWGLVRSAAETIEQARRAGQKVTADQYPYAASSTSLEATLIPTWARAGGEKKLLARLDEPEAGANIREAISKKLKLADDGARIKIARYAKKPQWAGRSLAEIAKAQGKEALDVAIEIVRGGGAAVVNFGMSEEDVRFVMTLPWVATASDGRAYLPGGDAPHSRSYGTFSRKIGFYALKEKQVPLEQAIHSSTGLPAEILGLSDRGRLKVGAMADVAVLDPRTYIDAATYDAPHQYSRGVRHVVVNGDLAILDGTPTGVLSGRALRKK